jgi:hypothetical protein
MILSICGGRFFFQSAAAESIGTSTPCSAHSWISGPLICAALGALPEITCVFSAVMAAAPAPPATAKSFQVYPCFCMSSFSTPTAFDSPPDVHQCSTSIDSAACTADTPHIRPAAHKAPMIARNFIAYLLQTPELKTNGP